MVNNDSSVLTSDRKVARWWLYSGYPVKIHPYHCISTAAAWSEKTQTAGPRCPATEHKVRQVRTDPAHSSGLRSKKGSSRRGRFFP